MKKTCCLLLVAALLASPALRAAELESARDVVLVLDLKAVGVDLKTARTLDQMVAESLAGAVDLRVITRADLDAMVEQQKDLRKLACDDQACIAEMSKAANARLVLSGSVGDVGGELLLTLSLLDTKKAASIGSVSRTTTDATEFAALIPPMMSELLGGRGGESARPRYHLPEGRPVSMAVFDIKSLGLTDQVADNLTEVLATELKGIEGTKVISRDDMEALLQLQAEKVRTMACLDDTSCLAELGGALGVEKLVVGHAGKLAESYVVSLRLIDVKAVNVDNRVTESFQGLESQLLLATRRAGRRLLGIDATEAGVLALTGSQRDAVVQLDNETIGALPIHPIERLTPRRHTVRVVKDGFEDWRTDFYVEPGGVTTMWADLKETPPAWYQRWWVWTIVGGVALTAGSVFYWQETRLPSSDLGTYPAN